MADKGDSGRVVELEGVDPLSPADVRRQLEDGGRIVEIEGARVGFLPSPDARPSGTVKIPPSSSYPSGADIPVSVSFEDAFQRLFPSVERSEQFDFGEFQPGVERSFHPIDGKTGRPAVTDDSFERPLQITLTENRGYDLPCPNEETICRLFPKNVWQQEQSNLQKLLRFIPRLPNDATANEATIASRWCIEVAKSISRMKKATNFANTHRLDDELYRRFYGEGEQAFQGQVWEPQIRQVLPFTDPQQAIDGGKEDAIVPWVFPTGDVDLEPSGPLDLPEEGWDQTPPNRHVIRPFTGPSFSNESAAIREAIGFIGSRVSLNVAFRVQPNATVPVDSDGARLQGRVGGRVTIQMLRAWAAHYAGLDYEDALMTCFSHWMGSNFNPEESLPRAGRRDAFQLRVSWNKIRDIESKNVSDSQIEADLQRLSEALADQLRETFRPEAIRRVQRTREATSLNIARDGKSRAQEILDNTLDVLDEAIAVAPTAVATEIRNVKDKIESLRGLSIDSPEDAADVVSKVAEITGDMAIVGDVMEKVEEAVEEVEDLGRRLKETAEEAFKEAVDEAIAKIALEIGISAALSATVVGAVGSLLSGALGRAVEVILEGFLRALGLIEGGGPKPPAPKLASFRPPLRRWPIAPGCNVDFERDADSASILSDFLNVMQDVAKVYDQAGDDSFSLGLVTRDSPLEPKDCGIKPKPVFRVRTEAASLVRAKSKSAGRTVAVVGGVGILGLLGVLLARGAGGQQTAGAEQEDDGMQPLRVENFPMQQAQARLQQLGAQYRQDRSTSALQVYWVPSLRQWVGARRRGKQIEIGYFTDCPCGGS